jgi:hypothetical protein
MGTTSKKKTVGPGAGFELRIVLTVLALLQIYSFSGVVLWSLLAGQVNLAIPVVVSFFSTMGLLFSLALGVTIKELIGWRRHFPVEGVKLYVSIAAIVPPILLTLFGGSAVLQAFSASNLTLFSPEVRYYAALGVASLLAFTYYPISDAIGVRNETREVPKMAAV